MASRRSPGANGADAAAAGGGEEPPSPTPTSSGAGHQGAAADGDERARQQLVLWIWELLFEKVQSTRMSLTPTTAARARETPATSGAAAGGSPTSTGAGHQGAAADEDERARQRVELRMREVKMKMEEAEAFPSPLGEQLGKAAREGRLSEVRRLIDSGANVNHISEFGNTPLIHAALGAHADVVSLLLQRGAEVNAVDRGGFSALHCAACFDRSGRCVGLLLNAGADVDARDRNGATPLHGAAYNNRKKAVRYLLAFGARKDVKPWGGPWKDNTPFDLEKL